MRNLKRALSLALASVMLMGMMVVGSSAASFPDVSAEDNTEAIAVLEAVKVMIGNENGEFEPEKNVTRNEMAVIMSKLMLGTYAADSYVGSHPFTDVPDWASKYVAACYSAGIIAGRSETTYDGNSTVTAVEAAAMMLRALGYEDLSKGAAQWDQPVAAKANEINLFAGLNGAGNAPMNRNSVAKLSLNTLQATMVTTVRTGQDITLPDGTVISGTRNYSLRTESYGWANAIDDEGDPSKEGYGYLQLGEYLYKGKLEKASGAPDSQGRPGDYKWVYDTEDVCDVLKDAKHTLKNNYTGKDLYNTLGKTVVDSINKDTDARELNVYVDGDEVKDTALSAFKTALTGKSTTKYGDTSALAIGNGTRTEIFISDKAVDVCIINTFGGEVDKVYTADDVKDDEKPYVLVGGLKFETTEFHEEDVVAYTKGKDGSKTVIASMEMATPVEGEVTKATAGKNFTVDGETYEFNRTLANGDKIGTDNVKHDVLVYVDANGYMIFKGDATASTDYAYVVSCGKGEVDRYDDSKFTFHAKLLFTDGTLKEVTLKDVANDGTADADDAKDAYANKIVTYTEDDGDYKLTVPTGGAPTLSGAISSNANLDISQGVASMKLNNATNNASANSETVFLVCNDADDEDYDVYVGFKNVPDIDGAGGTSKVAYATKQGITKVVYVESASVDVASDADMIVIIGDKDSELVKEGSDEYYEFKAVIDGEETTVKVDKAAVDGGACTALNDSDKHEKAFVIQKIKENSKGFITSYTEYASLANGDGKTNCTGTKKASNDVVGFGYSNGSYTQSWSYADDAQVVYRDEDGNLRTGGISLVRTDENDEAIVVLEKDKVIGVFVQEVAATEATSGYVSSEVAKNRPLIVDGSAAKLTNVDWTSNDKTSTSSLDGKTLSVTVPGVERVVLKFEVTFTTATVTDSENDKVQVYSANDISFKDALNTAAGKLQKQANAWAATKEAGKENYTKITGISITGKANQAITGSSATGDMQAFVHVADINNAQKPEIPENTADVTFTLTEPTAGNGNTLTGGGATKDVTVNVVKGTETVKITANKAKGQTIESNNDYAVAEDTNVIVVNTKKGVDEKGEMTFTLTVSEDKKNPIIYTVKVIVAKATEEGKA